MSIHFFNAKTISLLSVVVTSHMATAQNKSFVKILPGDGQEAIIHKAASVVPSPRQLRWQQLELTAFFHFGINTFINKEWGDGTEDISLFNPAQLDAGQWVKTMKDAGFRQVIITAKHHDGFCLWPSKFTEHSVKNTPYKNGKGDVVKEVAEACRKYKIGFGVYLSPWDRNSKYYGTDQYNIYFINQLKELLINYGKCDEVWFDGANGEGPNGKKQVYDFDNWYSIIRKLQPQAVIAIQGPDVRWVGTESGVGREMEWSVLPLSEQSQEKIQAASQKDIMVVPGITGKYDDQDRGSRAKINTAKGLVWYPAETDVSIRPGWFYHPAEDEKGKTAADLMDIYFTSVGRNGVLLLNTPPDTRGLISDNDVKNLQAFSKKMTTLFSQNLAAGSSMNAANGKNMKALLDNKLHTYFTTLHNDTTTAIEFNLAGIKTFDVVLLQENIALGQRVEKFIVEYFDGTEWKQFTGGTTIGYKRLLKFDPVTTSKIRLSILSSRLNPALSTFGLYKLQ